MADIIVVTVPYGAHRDTMGMLKPFVRENWWSM